jgi:4-oxalocrotonate tautomerase
MPHVIVKLWPGKSEVQKTRLAETITKNVSDITALRSRVRVGSDGRISSHDWIEKVYRPDIQDQSDKLYKKPGCDEQDP